MSLEPEVRRHFERAIELVTAARARDGELMADLMRTETLEGASGAAIAAAVMVRDAFNVVCGLTKVDPDEAWADYAVECQKKWDRL